MKFRDLSIGDTFDFISPNQMLNSFYLRCTKTSTRTYTDEEETRHRVGSINAEVYNVRVPVSCDQCQMLSINGVACHETGCPNQNSRWDKENRAWVKQRKCFDCGCTVDASDPFCSAPFDEDEVQS